MKKNRLTSAIAILSVFALLITVALMGRPLHMRRPAQPDCNYIQPVAPISVRIKLLENSDFDQHETDYLTVPEKYANLIYEMISHPRRSNFTEKDFVKLCELEITDANKSVATLAGVWRGKSAFTFLAPDGCVYNRDGPYQEIKKDYFVDEVLLLCAMVDYARAKSDKVDWCYDQLNRSVHGLKKEEP